MENKEISFDVVMSFDIRPSEGLKIAHDEISAAYPEYKITIAPDIDVSATD